MEDNADAVYDVNIKYNSPEGKKSYMKRGFTTKKEAMQHEAEMKTKLLNPTYTPVEQMQEFMSKVIGTEREMTVLLAGMYGLSLSEILGLR